MLIVIVEDAVPDPGVTDGAEKLHELRAGRLEQESATGLLYTPNCVPTDMLNCADCPALIVAALERLEIVKSVTVICTLLVRRDAVAPPLLAVSVSVFTPSGQVRLGLLPLPTPQAPLQLNVREQLSGSVPLPLRVTAAPLELVPLTVWFVPAFGAGKVAVTAARASTKPNPSMLFGTA